MAPASSANLCRVIIAERDGRLLSALTERLQSEGLDVRGVTDSRNLYLALLQRPASIVILSSDLPQEGGLAVALQLRLISSTSSVGIIMLTQGSPEQRIEGLRCGADASLQKPVDMLELLAHIRTLDRRVSGERLSQPGMIWQFHLNEWKLVSPSGTEIGLSHLESAFTYIIAKHAGKPVKRREIISGAFGKDPLQYDNRRLEAIVCRLRKKVHRSYPLSQPIRVVHSIGYVFTDAIRCVELPLSEPSGDSENVSKK